MKPRRSPVVAGRVARNAGVPFRAWVGVLCDHRTPYRSAWMRIPARDHEPARFPLTTCTAADGTLRPGRGLGKLGTPVYLTR